MKRITTAAIAAATAMSLATVPAMAEEEGSSGNGGSSVGSQEGNNNKKSSEYTNEEAINYAKDNKDKAKGPVKSALDKDDDGKSLGSLASSLKSDKANDWEPGKTANILLGTGITAAILAVIAFLTNGGGLKLPF
ncbi:hypothetical protein [Corynebacterium riegelii]|uniref:hypothetical protein n=1 Tax=Corynebacterium riegelii TaxID=156976 RepID=UPI00191D599B|nr:hypothetical protein [Corynebacterium riegelii]QQU84533.1 hypothetical protein I6I71_02925 [Corynebacterium riegelii]